jgi:hypothetical protein
MMFIRAFSFRKVCLLSNVHFVLCDSQLITWPNRNFDGSQRLVRQHYPPDIYLIMFQGGSARSGVISRSRGIQARAFSRQRWERPRRPDTCVSIWCWKEDLCWTSFCRCDSLHRCLISPLHIQCHESKG